MIRTVGCSINKSEFTSTMEWFEIAVILRLIYYAISIVGILFICNRLDIFWTFLFRKWPCFFLGYLVDTLVWLVFLYQLNVLKEKQK